MRAVFTRGVLLTVTTLIFLTSCSDTESPIDVRPVEHASSVVLLEHRIQPAAPSVAVGSTVQLRAVRDSAGVVVPVTVEWWTRDAAFATVSSTGLVKGIAVGTAVIGAETAAGAVTTTVTVVPASSGGTLPVSGGALLKLAFGSYLGGSAVDLARDVAADAQGNVYVVGGTSSANFPTTAGAFDRTFTSSNSSYQDAFITKLSPAGQVLWSTFLGGPGYDRAYAVEVDRTGFVYVAGRAGNGFPVTAGSFQPTFVGSPNVAPYGPQDGFVCKFRPDGTRVFCSYFGDTSAFIIRDLAVDDLGNIYLGTGSNTSTFPSGWFVNAFQKTGRGGVDAVIAKIKTDGSQVIWATYLGGTSNELPTPTVRVDAAQNVYVFDGTNSSNMPTLNGFDFTYGGQTDGYVAKFAADGSRLIWASYLGGSQSELVETHHMTIDPVTGDVIVAAGTRSPDFPTTINAFQRVSPGFATDRSNGVGSNYGGDAFVTRIAANGTRLVASTFLGGRYGDGAEGIWLDRAGAVHVSGTTYSPNFPTTVAVPEGLFQNNEMFVVKMTPDLSRLIYGSRHGGGASDIGRACYVDAAGALYAVGQVNSNNVPLLNAFQPRFGGVSDAIVFKFVPTGG